MKVLIIGLGQDGCLMSELLLASGIDFRVIVRRTSGSVFFVGKSNIPNQYIISVLSLNDLVLTDLYNLFQFTHVFNFAANSFVQDSVDNYADYISCNSSITWLLLRFLKNHRHIWLMHPLSSEILSESPKCVSDIARCIAPRNAYGLSKVVDMHSCEIQRTRTGLSILSPIVFNHESRHRPPQFFSRKIVNYLQMGLDRPRCLQIYNTKSVRDWGSAAEYMEILLQAAMCRLTGISLLGTGCAQTVEMFIDHALCLHEISVEKFREDDLLRWNAKNFSIIESESDLDDVSRVVFANRIMVEEFFGQAPKIYGFELVRQLVEGEI